MSVQSEHPASGDLPHRAATIGDINDPAGWGSFCGATQSLLCAAGEIMVVRVTGKVDLSTFRFCRPRSAKVSPTTPPVSSSIWPG